MALSIFEDRGRTPARSDLERALGPAVDLWDRLVLAASEQHPPVEEVWNFAGPKFGWSLRLIRKGRVVLYLIPQDGLFLAAIVLGEKAVKAAHSADLPQATLAAIDEARPYAEGRGIRLEVRGPEDVGVMLKLTALKLGK